jgi:hypothetical protein
MHSNVNIHIYLNRFNLYILNIRYSNRVTVLK